MHTSSASFGDTLKEYRQRKKLTQRQLATALGVHYNTIWAWERGDYLPETRGIVLELAQLLSLNEQETRHLLEASLIALSPYWMVPAQRNPFFTSRQEVLLQLHRVLQRKGRTQARSYALSGMGGVGKTQVALEYAYRSFQDYSAIFWITAETHESIFTSLSQLAELLQLPLGQDQQKMLDAITRWLTNHRDWLLIVDNVEDPALVHNLLPKARQGAFLFTTRRQSLGALAPCTTLEPMNQEEGIQFLLHRSGQREQVSSAETSDSSRETAAGELVKTLGGLPLALDQAGAYIEKTHCSLPDFLHLFQEHTLTLLEERDHHADHPLSVASTFALAFEKVQQEHPAAADLLRLCSLLAPDDIPEELFTQNASLLGDELAIVVTQPLKWNAVLQTLLSYAPSSATHKPNHLRFTASYKR